MVGVGVYDLKLKTTKTTKKLIKILFDKPYYSTHSIHDKICHFWRINAIVNLVVFSFRSYQSWYLETGGNIAPGPSG